MSYTVGGISGAVEKGICTLQGISPLVVSSSMLTASLTYDPISSLINNKGDSKMKNLYQVFAVSKGENIIINGKTVVANNENEAIFELKIHEIIRSKDLTLEQVTIIIKNLGSVKVYTAKE